MLKPLLFAVSLLSFTLVLAQPPLIPRDSLFQEKDQYRISLSPDGRRLYYQRRSDRQGRIFYLETARPGREKSLSFGGGALLGWQPTFDGGLLGVVQQTNKQLVYLSADGQKQPVAFPAVEQLRIEALSPQRPQEVVIAAGSRKEGLNGLFRLNFRNGKRKKISSPLPYQKLYFDQQLQPCAARHPNEIGGFSIYRHDGENWIETLQFPFDESQFLGGFQDVISVSAEGARIFATSNLGRDKTALVAIAADDGREELLVADGKADVLPFGAMASPSGEPQMVLSVFADARRHFIDAEAQRDFDYANRLLRGQASFGQASANGRQWLLRRLNGGPITYYLFDRDSRQLTKLFNDFPPLEGYPLASRRAFSVITRDGYELPVHVYLPPGADPDGNGIPEKPLPTLLYVHGGPWAGVIHWNQWYHNRNFQLLANRGYAVINTEFRGSTGLGSYFTGLGDKQWGEDMHQDKVDIARWALEKGIAREGRLGIWGWSYGGYAAAAALAFSPELFACGISMYGPSDLDAFTRIPFADNELWRSRVGNHHTPEGSAMLRRQSPINYVDKIQGPMLLTTGSKDGRVPQRQVDRLAEALEQAGKKPIYFYYPNEGHDYQEPGSWTSFWAIAEAFLHQQLGGRYEPVGDSLEKGKFEIVYGRDFIRNLR